MRGCGKTLMRDWHCWSRYLEWMHWFERLTHLW